MDNILEKRLLSWYELDIVGTDLIIRIHDMVIPHVKDILLACTGQLLHTETELSLPAFLPFGTDAQWGFGGCVECKPGKPEKKRWVTFYAPLPVVSKTGALEDTDWSGAYALSATLNILFYALNACAGIVRAGTPQHCCVSLSTRKAMYGCSLSCALSSGVGIWVSREPDDAAPYQKNRKQVRPEVNDAMARVYQHMMGPPKYPELPCRAKAYFVGPKWIHLDCPGDACGLDPETYASPKLNVGYRLVPHNVDTPMQQLTLLAGIAAVMALVRNGR
ncbi:MAG: hypothetical protein KGI50_01265 [Patescibacteria group bacterium]|nr:hypothetical protein [Patescibacteria group bacterium]MDE2438021.1 hypothetical protein [Patescibacteria group bacterium]